MRRDPVPFTVRSVMTAPAITMSVGARFRELVDCLRIHNITAVPIVDAQGRPLGVVSESDLMLKEQEGVHGLQLVFSRRRRREQSKAEAVTAASLMTSPAITIRATETLRHAAKVLHDRDVRRLVVVDGTGTVVGVLSRGDVLRVFARPDEHIRNDVIAQLRNHFWLEPVPVRVSVVEGVVTLEGTVERASESRSLAGRLADVDGVVTVENHLDYIFDDMSVAAVGGAWPVPR